MTWSLLKISSLTFKSSALELFIMSKSSTMDFSGKKTTCIAEKPRKKLLEQKKDMSSFISN